ncbi:MAG: zinc metalloprotease HtpX [Eubacterium sp.]
MMYFKELMKRLFRENNLTMLIYLFINLLIIFSVVYSNFLPWGAGALLISAVVYVLSMMLAVSPVGESIMRFRTGCKKIRRTDDKERLEPIFQNVYEKAREEDPDLSPDIKLFIHEDDDPNAFATGRNTICVNTGLLNQTDDTIEAVLAHEFAHISHKDTDLLLLVGVGNIIVTVILFIAKLISTFAALIVSVLFKADCYYHHYYPSGRSLLAVLVWGIFTALEWLWAKFGLMMLNAAGRKHEYAADEFANKLGYGTELCRFLDTYSGDGEHGFFAALMSTHPSTDDRIANMQEHGCEYRRDMAY